jgi:nitroimidazol reductase NimA-like FMN-containing flavoprotein (pyridoxamine 5'-phosphate oxidase superfamily)
VILDKLNAKARQSGHKKIKFTEKEVEFLLSNEGCRVATITPNNTPHIAPVSFVFEGQKFYFATDYNTRKYKNLKENPKIALAVDVYSSVNNKAVIIHGNVNFIERGRKFKELYDIFYRKFDWVRDDPWKEGEAPFVQVEPYKKISWGLD